MAANALAAHIVAESRSYRNFDLISIVAGKTKGDLQNSSNIFEHQ